MSFRLETEKIERIHAHGGRAKFVNGALVSIAWSPTETFGCCEGDGLRISTANIFELSKLTRFLAAVQERLSREKNVETMEKPSSGTLALNNPNWRLTGIYINRYGATLAGEPLVDVIATFESKIPGIQITEPLRPNERADLAEVMTRVCERALDRVMRHAQETIE